MFQTISEDTQRQSLRCAERVLLSRAVRHASRELEDLDDPSTVDFLLDLVRERHEDSLPKAATTRTSGGAS